MVRPTPSRWGRPSGLPRLSLSDQRRLSAGPRFKQGGRNVRAISLKLVELFSSCKREEGQGATEYAMVIGFLVVGLTLGLGLLGVGINDFLGRRRRQPRRAGPVERPGSGRIQAPACICLRPQRRGSRPDRGINTSLISGSGMGSGFPGESMRSCNG